MKLAEFKNNEKRLGKAYFFLEDPLEPGFVDRIVEQIEDDEDIGFAGFKDKEFLKNFLNNFVYGNNKAIEWNKVGVTECKEGIDFVLDKCSQVIQGKVIRIFIFPTVDKFVIDKLGGVAGFSPWKNTILLGVFNTPKIDAALRDTLAHELAHALAFNYNRRETIGDDIVSEGLAEHFREFFLDGAKSKWVNSISEEKAKEILKEIKPKLNIRDEQLYCELFFGSGRYPLWAGYAVGYYIIKLFLSQMHEENWVEMLKMSAQDILKHVGVY